MMTPSIPTPSLVLDAVIVRRNIDAMARYTAEHQLGLRPHSKTHKSTKLGQMQRDAGAIGLTVAKAGEAAIMAEVADDLLLAYPIVDEHRAQRIAELAGKVTVRVALDSTLAAEVMAHAAQAVGGEIGILVDRDVGFHRTGVQSAEEALAIAQLVERTKGVRLDGIMFYPGHLARKEMAEEAYVGALRGVDAILEETVEGWRKNGLEARIISGGTSPTALDSHLIKHQTEIRPGTYIFQDMNGVHGGYASIDDCAARVHATVVSTAVPGQVVIDAGSKVLTSDRCGPAPESGHGLIVEYPDAKIAKLSEEHGQVDVGKSSDVPKVGERVTIIPNHICPCVNLQDAIWWCDEGHPPERVPVEARGMVV
ncbi:D-threonine aldolase [Planctomycetes bacterium Pan216]|uniref:D-threonine aldolase n=1 Tax=Kolteria novifilia TaxID=2527975 RepID=A0A518B5D0_9BACT|nr:D-threonine aldolase [Planctomycetes bacterium Pan216]